MPRSRTSAYRRVTRTSVIIKTRMSAFRRIQRMMISAPIPIPAAMEMYALALLEIQGSQISVIRRGIRMSA
jgi:hypothetical protein